MGNAPHTSYARDLEQSRLDGMQTIQEKETRVRHILCFGDSNTYGVDPVLDRRLARDQRWTGVLRDTLGEGYEIFEEGQGSRTTIWDDPLYPYKNGRDYLIPCLESHAPLDLVVLALGTNDMKHYFQLSPAEIAEGAGVLVRVIQKSDAGSDGRAPLVLLLSPPLVGKLTHYRELYAGAPEKSRELGKHYKMVAEMYHCAFLDTARVITTSDADGIHFEHDEHRKLGQAVAAVIRQLLEA